MSSFAPTTRHLAAAVAACAALLAVTLPAASAAPATDGQGFVDSTARCSPPATAVAFGSTATSRVAICKSSGGQYEYRGVRVRDGAKLILPATQSGGGAFVAENDGITYTVTSNSLTVSVGSRVTREEPMEFYRGPETPTTPSTGTTGTSTTSTAPTTPTSTTPTSTTPLPPPLPAEVGGAGR